MVVGGARDWAGTVLTITMNSTTFTQRVGSVAEDHGLEALIDASGGVIVVYGDAREFAAKAMRDALAIVDALVKTDAVLIEASAGEWSREGMPPFRLCMRFGGVESPADTNYGAGI